jgi:Iodothyronine deiodinase
MRQFGTFMDRILLWIAVSVAGLLLLAFAALSVMAGSPKDAVAMVRFALPHMHVGQFKVGDNAPDARLVALDGTTRFQIHDRINYRPGGRPLVLIFGSFT